MMTSTFRSLLLGVGLALGAPLALGLPATAAATSVAPLTIEQFTDASTYIVRGTVTELWTETDAEGLVWTRARVQVSRTLKGPDEPSEIIIDTLGSSDPMELPQMHGAARFSVDEEIVAFLDEFRPGRFSPVAAGTGKLTVRRAPGDTRSYAASVRVSDRVRYDARFLPHPVASERVYVDDLEARIDTRLDAGWDGVAIPGLSADRLRAVNTPERRKR